MPYNLAISLVMIYQKILLHILHREIYTEIFTVALFL